MIPEEEEFPKGQTSQQIQQQDAQDMTTSQQDAAAAALRELGITVPEVVTVQDITASAPAAKVLKKGDVITSIDGTSIIEQRQAALADPGAQGRRRAGHRHQARRPAR